MSEGRASKQAYWQWHLRQWEVVGGTLKEYAESQGVSVKSLYAARSAVRNEERPVPVVEAPASTAKAPARFIPLKLPARRRDERVHVECPNGFSIEVPADVSERDWLQLRALFQGSR